MAENWASIEDLKNCPSCQLAPNRPYRRYGFAGGAHRLDKKLNIKHIEVDWTEGAECVLVVALSHPENKPELDYWQGRTSSPGNKVLMKIIKELCRWIEYNITFETKHLPYQVGQGGLYLKDACVLAGFGCIGANNLLVTPEFGPRVRFRALAVNAKMPSTGPIDFNPCAACDQPCLRACPQKAMDTIIYDPNNYQGLTKLPGRNGNYNVDLCDLEMNKAVETAEEEFVENKKIIKYCRRCEFACPVGA